ncbi:MAG: WecB/TagA/CpsF family glycosyltransferase [Verrucomicrobiaceae bacterium]|nr:WecB/TagA/CpsF family glycosyltransferase [Verrucomicrobiaceae bacterium]
MRHTLGALMNILVIYPYIPYPIDRGTFQRTFHLLRELAHQHTVDLIALSENGERLEQSTVFEQFCRDVRFVPFQHPAWPKLIPNRLFSRIPSSIHHWNLPHIADAIRDQLKRNSYDLVHVCDIVLAQYFLDEHQDIPLSIDRSRVDLQFQTQQAAFNTRTLKDKLLTWESLTKMRHFEKRVARRSQLQVLCGPDDETFVRHHISQTAPLKVVPNGVDLDYFRADIDPEPRSAQPTVLFCGAMDYMPNIDAMRWFFGEIHESLMQRIPNLQVLIVGKSPNAEVQAYARLPGVTVTGSVPDVRPYYRRAWLQMVPLRIGGGTRLKIVESLAIGTPVISTTIGAQGLGLTHGANILLADTPSAFADQIVSALQNPPLRNHLRNKGICVAKKRFGWRSIGAELIAAYRHFEPKQRKQVRLMDVPFDVVTMSQTIDRVEDMIASKQPHYLATANVDFLVQCRKDAELRRILQDAHLVVCDGTPLVWLSKLLRRSLPERVAGSDLVPKLLSRAETEGWRIFFLGGDPSVLSQAIANVEAQHPGIQIVGSFSPPFAPIEGMDHETICQQVREAKPDLLLVSFGCPKQEKWIARHYQALGVPVSIGVGATIDFLAGSMKRAPRWMQFIGMEWLFRLAQEPRRLLKRYATDLVVFGMGSIREITRSLITTKAPQRA